MTLNFNFELNFKTSKVKNSSMEHIINEKPNLINFILIFIKLLPNLTIIALNESLKLKYKTFNP